MKKTAVTDEFRCQSCWPELVHNNKDSSCEKFQFSCIVLEKFRQGIRTQKHGCLLCKIFDKKERLRLNSSVEMYGRSEPTMDISTQSRVAFYSISICFHWTKQACQKKFGISLILKGKYRWVPLNPNTDKSKSRLIRSFLEIIDCMSHVLNCMLHSKLA